jgi:acyl-coenzyme A thioesterase PaaI-like protein
MTHQGRSSTPADPIERARRRSATPPPDATAPDATAAAGPILGPHVPNYAHCHGCGPGMHGGLGVRVVAVASHGIDAEVEIVAAHQGAPGLTHGGVLAGVMDEVMSLALWRLLNRPYVTARLETSYLAPVPLGSVLHVTATCTGLHGRKAYTEARARTDGPDSPVAVYATALWVAGPRTHWCAPAVPALEGKR